MYTVELKIGRNLLLLDENDLILDNGTCYQIVTKKINKGSISNPIISKVLFNKMKKLQYIRTNSMLKEIAQDKYNSKTVTYWQFSIDHMIECNYKDKL